MPDMRQVAAEYADQARKQFLNTFSHVPDDKLNWSPVPGASAALKIAFHVSGSAEWFIPVLRGEKPDFSHEESVTDNFTRDCAISAINSSTDKVIEAIKTLSDDRLGAIVDLGPMKLPMSVFIMIPGRHIDGHAGQIDYLQTCWGDQEFYL